MGDVSHRLAERVGRVVSSTAARPVSAAVDEASFDRVEQRLAARCRRGGRSRLGPAVALASLVALGGSWVARRLVGRADEGITYRVADGPVLRQGELGESGNGSSTREIRFSDGTRLTLEPRARGRVVALDARGGRVNLDQGRARVEVRHREDTRWLFQAGPFEVRVHGTAFAMAWDPATARFELHMASGVVSVAGPISGGEMVLRAGETLSVGLHDEPPAAAAASAPAGASAPPDEPAAADADVASPVGESADSRSRPRRAVVARPVRDWRDELANGRAAAVLADARRRGLNRVLDAADSEDLAALADAARYLGNDDLARRAFFAQRRRFAGSPRAAEASFLLGRLEDESSQGTARALAWYDRYLQEAPGGAFVSEALGRKMMALQRAGRDDAAGAVAADYLRRFPAGTYAPAARSLVHRLSTATELSASPRP